AARLLWDKGIREYVDAAKIIKNAGLPIEFLLAGAPDPGNPASVPEAKILEWKNAGYIIPLGHVNNMKEIFSQVDVMILPTAYGEGVPRSLIEAAASGLPIIATDAPGCREIVDHGVNGHLVPMKDAKAIANSVV